MIQAYKLQGKIDQTGHLVLMELPLLPAGNVEVIVLHSDAQNLPAEPIIVYSKTIVSKTAVKAFQDLFKQTEPAPLDFDPDQARWEALQEKHNL
jgi:hypothetical protein